MSEGVDQKNTKIVRNLVFVVLGMFCFGYALVPIYDVFCDITGLNGKTDEVAAVEQQFQVDINREITLEFVTSLNKAAQMAFRVEKNRIKVHPGKYYTVSFYAENLTDKKMVARAIPSVSPGSAAEYLKKTECFCFTEQTFEPKESKLMPVRFAIDPAIPEKYKTLTLAYTFFDNTKN